MYPENPEGTQVIVGSMNMGYISDTARNRTHNLFRPKREPIPLGHRVFISVAHFSRWRHWKCGDTQLQPSIICMAQLNNSFVWLLWNLDPGITDEGSGQERPNLMSHMIQNMILCYLGLEIWVSDPRASCTTHVTSERQTSSQWWRLWLVFRSWREPCMTLGHHIPRNHRYILLLIISSFSRVKLNPIIIIKCFYFIVSR